MKNAHPTLLASLALATAMSLAGCDRNEGVAERAGKSIDNAADTAARKLENAGDKIKDAADDAKK